MTLWVPDRNWPKLIADKRWTRNGQAPDGRFLPKVGQGLIHCAALRKKIICEKAWDVSNLHVGQAAVTDVLHCATITGHQTTQIAVMLNLAAAYNKSATDPYCDFTVTPGLTGGADVTETLHYGAVVNSSPVPDDILWGQLLRIDVLPNALYRMRLRVADYCRIISATIFEFAVAATVDDTASGGVDPRCSVDSAITDDRELAYLTAATNLWDSNGCHYFGFFRDAAAPSTASVTWINIADLTSGPAVTAATPGVLLQTLGHNTRRQSAVPVRIAVHGQRTGGIGDDNDNKVRITDGANPLEVSGIAGTSQWYSATGTLPVGADQKFDPQAITGAFFTIEVDSIQVWAEL